MVVEGGGGPANKICLWFTNIRWGVIPRASNVLVLFAATFDLYD